MTCPTPYAAAIAHCSYHRPIQNEWGTYENWSQVVERVMGHQRWLWERALGRHLNEKEEDELDELKVLIQGRCILPDGRTLWLCGTDLSRKRESCLFNSAFTNVETVYDIVDLFWLLLQGCSVGFHPVTGTLNGFRLPLDSIELIRSCRFTADGSVENVETYDKEIGVWTLRVGDSAEAFAKAVGKLVAGKYPAKKLILDLSEIRPAGSHLKGYGWVSMGDEPLSKALYNIANILSNRADQLLTRVDILEIIHHLGIVPSSKRSAQLAIFEYGQPEWEEIAKGKKEWEGKRHLAKNMLLFQSKPSKEELQKLFHLILESGGSEPGIMNAGEACHRAPWFKGCNPSGDGLLGNKSFCTFVEVNLLSFQGDKVGLERALNLAARMNYRQTLVSLRDEILQEAWHLNNEFLHLCGVSLTGVRARQDLMAYDFKRMRNITVSAAFGMARELNTPLPKNVTCIKPSRTLTKIMGTKEWCDVPEGIQLPLGKYVFHNVSFARNDPLLETLRKKGYQVTDKPYSKDTVLVKFPASYANLPFSLERTTRKNGKVEELEVNTDSALDQLEWYLQIQETWSEQNVSNTVYYDPSEVPEIIDWLMENWENYIGTSFAFRNDPLKSAEELGLSYLEQEVVSEEVYQQYVLRLRDLDESEVEVVSCSQEIADSVYSTK